MFCKLNKTILITFLGGYFSYKIYNLLKNKYTPKEENSVESELREFLSENNEICKNCNSFNRNILKKSNLKCWNCDSILNEENHPTTTIN